MINARVVSCQTRWLPEWRRSLDPQFPFGEEPRSGLLLQEADVVGRGQPVGGISGLVLTLNADIEVVGILPEYLGRLDNDRVRQLTEGMKVGESSFGHEAEG